MDAYTLRNKLSGLTVLELETVIAYPPTDKSDWIKARYDAIKQRIKRDLLEGQFDKCAYCRKMLEGAGKYEPLEHIVAKSIRPEWMFEPKNLIVTCDSCNNLKGDEQVLADCYIGSFVLPNVSEAYLIFNPHYDEWSDHLQYEDDLFITDVPGSKGRHTIKICKLYRFNIIINRSKERKLHQKTPLQRIASRIQKMDKHSPEFVYILEQLSDAITFFANRTIDNENYD